jgi:hypothetical protein
VQGPDIDRKLTGCLACIDQVRHTRLLTDSAHRFHRLNQSRIGGYPCERHQSRAAAAHQSPYLLGIHSAFTGVGCANDLDASTARERQIHDLIRGVVGPAGKHHVPRAQVEGAHGLGECDGRVLDQGDVSRSRPDEPGHSLISIFDLLDLGLGSFVAAELLFQRQMGEYGVVHSLRDQRRAGIIEVGQAVASRRVGAPASEIRGETHRAIHAFNSSIPRSQ